MGAVRQSVDQLAARQQQMANAIATLKGDRTEHPSQDQLSAISSASRCPGAQTGPRTAAGTAAALMGSSHGRFVQHSDCEIVAHHSIPRRAASLIVRASEALDHRALGVAQRVLLCGRNTKAAVPVAG
jgi:hypothetical protein